MADEDEEEESRPWSSWERVLRAAYLVPLAGPLFFLTLRVQSFFLLLGVGGSMDGCTLVRRQAHTCRAYIGVILETLVITFDQEIPPSTSIFHSPAAFMFKVCLRTRRGVERDMMNFQKLQLKDNYMTPDFTGRLCLH